MEVPFAKWKEPCPLKDEIQGLLAFFSTYSSEARLTRAGACMAYDRILPQTNKETNNVKNF